MLLMLGATACHVTPYQRTLPEWVRNVYVPMADNQSYEPGLEELVTNALAEELLADGRLTPVQKSQADVVLKITLARYDEATAQFEDDDVERRRSLTLLVVVTLYDPNDMRTPIGAVPGFRVSINGVSDLRSVEYEPLPDIRGRLAHEAGREIVKAVLTRAAMGPVQTKP